VKKEKENTIYNEDMQFQVDLEIASFVLRSGGVLLYPTETVWGIGCDATNEDAVEMVLELKKTTDRKSMIVIVDDFSMLKRYVKTFPHQAVNILKESKKPTTIIYPGAKNLAENIIAPDDSVGMRITTNPFCLELLKKFKKPIVSTSANFTGNPTPVKFRDINIDIIYNSDYVVRWGQDKDSITEPSQIIKILDNGETVTIR